MNSMMHPLLGSIQTMNSKVHGTKAKLVKVGHFGNSLVRAESAHVEGLPSFGQETKPAKMSAKAAREQANARCVGGLRSPWRSTKALHQAREAGEKVKAALRQALT